MVYGSSVDDATFASEPSLQLKWAILYPSNFSDEPRDLSQRMVDFGSWLMCELSRRGRIFGHYIGISPNPDAVFKISKQRVFQDCDTAYRTLAHSYPHVIVVLHILGGDPIEHHTSLSLSMRYGVVRQCVKLENAINRFFGIDFDDVVVKVCSWISRRCSQMASSRDDTERPFRILRTVPCGIERQDSGIYRSLPNKDLVIRNTLSQNSFASSDLRGIVDSILHHQIEAKAMEHHFKLQKESEQIKSNEANGGQQRYMPSHMLLCRVRGLPRGVIEFDIAAYFAPFTVSSVKIDAANRLAYVRFPNKYQLVQAVVSLRRSPPIDGFVLELPVENDEVTKAVSDLGKFFAQKEQTNYSI